MLTFLLLLLLVAGLYAAQAYWYGKCAMKYVQYRCYFDREEACEGDRIQFIEEVENRHFLPMPWLKAEFSVSRFLDFANTHSTVTDKTRFVTSFFLLKGCSRVRRVWEVDCLRRGEFSIGRVLLVTTDLLGTELTSQAAVDTGSLLTVLPRRHAHAGELLRTAVCMAGEATLQRQLLTDPFSAGDCRPYTGHEPRRRMDWRASAKLAQLMVRQEEPAEQQELTILYTVQTGEYGKRRVSDDAAEHTIRVCAALFDACTQRGMAFAVYGNCPAHGTYPAVPPSRGIANLQKLLYTLAATETETELPLFRCVPPIRSGGVAIVTPFLSEDIRRLKRQYPHAVIYLTAHDTIDLPDVIPIYEEGDHA